MSEDAGMQGLKEIFIAECYEMIEVMEQQLLGLDVNADTDVEALNAIFRGAHSMKGGAGALAFQEIYEFTHIMEALLDAMRSGSMKPTAEIIDTLLAGVDTVRQMVDYGNDGQAVPEGFGNDVKQKVQATLDAGSGGAAAPATEAAAETPASAPAEAPAENVAPAETAPAMAGGTGYHITFRPGAELFGSGNDPLFIFKQLENLGALKVEPELEKLPDWSDYDQLQCYVGWKLELTTDAGEADVKEIFEFVEGLAEIDIQPITDGATAEAAPAPTAAPAAPVPAEPEVAAPAAEAPAEAPQLEAAAPVEAAAATPAPAATEDHPAAPTAGGKAPAAAAAAGHAAATVRVDVDKIDRMVNMVGELVIAQSMLIDRMNGLPESVQSALNSSLSDLSRKTRDLQESVMSVRMQPVQSIFARMSRLARDLSRQLEKPFKLETAGESTEVDKTIIEKLSDPITHMIRNSADHGLEMPDKRVEKGKPREGTIYLSASHAGGKIVIEIQDDGAGINRERVLAKAKEKGLVMPDAELTPEQIDVLIFAPGFSTADEVSAVSGRGVGMDVVDKNIKDLGGGISIDNQPGKGARFTITLPLTLAILDGMVVATGKEKYIIPILNMVETFQPNEKNIKTIADGNDLINIRGEYIPMIYLNDVFNIQDSNHKASEGLVIVIETGRHKFGLVVDSLIGQQQVVIKTIDDQSEIIPGISGATILGDGKISLILDVAGIYQMLSTTTKKQIEKVNL